jgi:hypothetical protein
MEFDIKNSLLKSSIGGNKLAKKNINASIDDSLVTSMNQKNLDMDLEGKKAQQKKEQAEKEKENNKNKNKNLQLSQEEKDTLKIQEEKIVRDPLKLLKLF